MNNDAMGDKDPPEYTNTRTTLKNNRTASEKAISIKQQQQNTSGKQKTNSKQANQLRTC